VTTTRAVVRIGAGDQFVDIRCAVAIAVLSL
jgi:hypothetical protein